MRVLLDICALAELRHPRGNEAVKAAVALIPDDDLYLSALIVGEIARGVALLPDGRRKRALNAWLITLESQFADRILPWTLRRLIYGAKSPRRAQQVRRDTPGG